MGLVKRDGNYYAVEDFASTVANWTPAGGAEDRPIAPTAGAAASGANARSSSDLRDGKRVGRRDKALVHHALGRNGSGPFTGRVEQKISTGKYHKAAVGACSSGNPGQGFTTYKIAVMLY